MAIPTVSAETLDACHHLRTIGGLPCHVDEYGRLTLTIGGNVGALTLTEYWGYRVRARLIEFGIAGPVLWHPFQRFTFITGLYDPAEHGPHLDAVLRETDSILMSPGCLLTLPSPDSGSRGWDTPVQDAARPSMGAVLAALIACTAEE